MSNQRDDQDALPCARTEQRAVRNMERQLDYGFLTMLGMLRAAVYGVVLLRRTWVAMQ